MTEGLNLTPEQARKWIDFLKKLRKLRESKDRPEAVMTVVVDNYE